MKMTNKTNFLLASFCVVSILAITSLLISCDFFKTLFGPDVVEETSRNSPVDPGGDNYSGIESEDHDGDGIGEYYDVSEIFLKFPLDGATIGDITPELKIKPKDPSIVHAYCFQVSTTNNFTNPMIDIQVTDSSSYTIGLGELENSTTYYWRGGVIGKDNTSQIYWTESWSFTINVDVGTVSTVDPADNSIITDTTPLLDWEDVEGGAEKYWVQLASDSDISTVVEENNATTASSYQVATILNNGYTYYWRIRTYKNEAWGDWSSVYTFSIDVSTVVLSTPSDNASIQDTTPTLSWQANSIASKYNLILDDNSDFSSPIVDNSAITGTSYSLTGTAPEILEHNTTYYWKVALIDANNVKGNYSNTRSFTVNIEAVVLTLPNDNQTITDTIPTLEWEASPVASKYHLILADNNSFTSPIIDNPAITGTSYILSGTAPEILANDETYYWKVAAIDANNVKGNFSNTRSFTIDITIIELDLPASGNTLDNLTPTLSWTENPFAIKYHLLLSSDSSFTNIIVDDNTITQKSYTLQSPLANETTYYWKVALIDVEGNEGTFSDVWSFYIYHETFVSGLINTDTTWSLVNSPYVVTDNILLYQNTTLTIEPGVQVLFETGQSMQINGCLLAQGTSGSHITFTSRNSTPSKGAWGRIYFTDSSIDANYDVDEIYLSGSILEYCDISYGGGNSANGLLTIEHSSPFVNYSNINNSSSNGIYLDECNNNLKIQNTTIINNELSGIKIPPYDTIVFIENCEISYNKQSGINFYFYNGNGEFKNNIIEYNTGCGIVGQADTIVIVNGNTIRYNDATNGTFDSWHFGGSDGAGGVSIYSVGTNTIINNTFENNIGKNGGAIYVGRGWYSPNTTIQNNLIQNNLATNGAAIYLSYNSTLDISYNTISNNSSTNSIIHFNSDNGTDSLTYNIFNSNTAMHTLYINGNPSVNNNNFISNTVDYEIYNNNSSASPNPDINAENNWWNTTNTTEIDLKLYDLFDDINLGTIDYTPYLTSEETNAGQ